MKYYYPEDLLKKPKIYLWNLRDIIILSPFIIISVLMAAKTANILPAALSLFALAASVEYEGMSIRRFFMIVIRYIFGAREYIYRTGPFPVTDPKEKK